LTLLGPDLHDLELKDVQAFLDAADAEPLLWEAKGTDVHPDSVCKAVCGFANGRQTAYLILGADQDDAGWHLRGWQVPGGDPPAWVSSVINPALQPVPEVDVRSLRVRDGSYVVVVEVPPVAIPPCMSRGTVWERVSGRTIAVENPLRLSELYRRGEAEKVRAEHSAVDAAQQVILDPLVPGYVEEPDGHRFALALNATGNPADISSRLFSREFEEKLLDTVHERLVPIRFGGAEYHHGQEQSNCWLNVQTNISAQRLRYWHVRAIWDGTVVVRHQVPADYQLPPDQLMESAIKPAWTAAGKLVVALGGYGPTHMVLVMETGKKGPPRVGGTSEQRIGMRRHLLQPEPGQAAFASLTRELQRTSGQRVYEDPA
jgi:hypothetical protein